MKKVLVITGDSRGIGYEIAKRFYEKGYIVIGISRSDVDVPWIHIKGDISKIETWQLVREKVKEFGYLNYFVHNAGIHEKKRIEQLAIEEFERTMRVNLFSAFYGVKFLYDLMPREETNSILFISSIVAFTGSNSGGAAYSASKAALIGLARDLMKELKPIRVNVVAPGYVETSMISHWDEKRRAETIKKIPLNRLATPKDIADVVECLLEKCLYVNGEVIHVNGGLYTH